MSGRIRTVKPELLEDAVTAGLSETAFRLFVGMILLADDYGVLRAEPAYLHGQVFWRTAPAKPVDEALAEIARKLVVVYEAGGQFYAAIRNWEKHQKVSHRGKRRLPAPPETVETVSGDPPESLAKSSGESPEILRPDHRPATSDQRPSTDDQRTSEHAAVAAGPASGDPQSAIRIRAVEPAAPRRKSSGSSEYHRVTLDWRPRPETVERFRREGYDATRHVEEFVNHWFNAKGDKGLKKDWDLAFVNRMKDLIEGGRATVWTAPAKPPPATRDMFAEAGLKPVAIDGPLSAEDISSLFDGVGKIA